MILLWAYAHDSMAHSIPVPSSLNDIVDGRPFGIFRTVKVSPRMFIGIMHGVANAPHMIFLGLSKSPHDLRDSSMLGIGPLIHIKNIVKH